MCICCQFMPLHQITFAFVRIISVHPSPNILSGFSIITLCPLWMGSICIFNHRKCCFGIYHEGQFLKVLWKVHCKCLIHASLLCHPTHASTWQVSFPLHQWQLLSVLEPLLSILCYHCERVYVCAHVCAYTHACMHITFDDLDIKTNTCSSYRY